MNALAPVITAISASQITGFDDQTTKAIADMLAVQHIRLGQLDRPPRERTLTARNYDSAIKALGVYMASVGAALPTKSILGAWRDSLLQNGSAVSTANVKLAAARKLLRGVADDVTDMSIKTVLRDWAGVEDAKQVRLAKEDKTEADYGRRFDLKSLSNLIKSVDTSNLKGLRDRALIAVMAGAGLRVSEACGLTMQDVFATVNEQGQRGIKVRDGKHGKSRVIVLNGWNSWVLKTVEAYTAALGLTSLEHPTERIFRGVARAANGQYRTAGHSLSTRGAERAMNDYEALYMGVMVKIDCHDLRRTYAKICKQYGMSWDALRANMGHSSVTITEKYVGLDVDWSERVPNWTIEL